ncbi:hypothetical protein BV22DRAFT_1052428 [Leucogyrophana mollusca]|uniref:Uncharacterized protein n=1 Tax=Leucogyrophana mollusca TaxID=85980 RepID=A0ACB8AVP7_9AGAM|nr:hypothetical protein BV22DRAFT_1052428 [Leucogyrophana mollusca]
MSDDEQRAPASARKRARSALELGPRKKATIQDPLVHHGRHFGCMVHVFCNMQTLITNAIIRMGEQDEPDESLTATYPSSERREHAAFQELLKIIPNFEARLVEASEDDIIAMAELIQKGANGARLDDTKGIKTAVIDWITPAGQALVPHLPRNVKSVRGFNHERTSALLCPAGLDWSNQEVKEKLKSDRIQVVGDQWPLLLFANYTYDADDPWNGLLRSRLLVNSFKHTFTSPSSVDQEPKATRSGNAHIHGMHSVTKPSIAYVATQTRFALTSAQVFSRTDLATDSERFYNSILDLLEDLDEVEEVDQLMLWWNRQIFPIYADTERAPSKNSALARIREKRLELKERSVVEEGA